MQTLHAASRVHRAVKRREKPFVVGLVVATVVATLIAPGAHLGGPAVALAQQATIDPVAVAKEVGPAVVTILNEQKQQHFLRPATEAIAAAGSGFFIDEQGHIVTN